MPFVMVIEGYTQSMFQSLERFRCHVSNHWKWRDSIFQIFAIEGSGMKIVLKEWLQANRLSAESYDPELLLDSFLTEMERGLSGESSSLAMIPSYIAVGASVPRNKPVAIIDAGGTNLRVGVACIADDGTLQWERFNKRAMPGAEEEVSADEFYSILASELLPLPEGVDSIGFCFSYPAEILPDHDGRLIRWTKEIKIPGLIGECIGKGLLDYLKGEGANNSRVVLLNDTIATLLAGCSQSVPDATSSYVGFILGTGTNTAYVEQNKYIGKLFSEGSTGAQGVNVESGGFNAFERGLIDLRLDERSEHPGSQAFEKAISGVYMGSIVLETAKALIPEGVFSEAAAREIESWARLSTMHIDNLASDNGRDIGPLAHPSLTIDDCRQLSDIFCAVRDRAALLTSVNIAAAVIKTGEGCTPDKPVCVAIDGSTYYKTAGLSSRVQTHLQELLVPRGLHVSCIQVADAPATGAAVAALTAMS